MSDDNQSFSQEVQPVSNGNGNLRVRYRYKTSKFEAEFEAEGPIGEVNYHTGAFLSSVPLRKKSARKELPAPGQMPLFPESETPPLADDGALRESMDDNLKTHHAPQDMRTFYREKSPKHQWEAVLVVTYYGQNCLRQPCLSLKDYEAAFTELRKIPVDVPGNLGSSVRIVTQRTDYLYTPEPGKFPLTDAGKEFVEKMEKAG